MWGCRPDRFPHYVRPRPRHRYDRSLRASGAEAVVPLSPFPPIEVYVTRSGCSSGPRRPKEVFPAPEVTVEAAVPAAGWRSDRDASCAEPGQRTRFDLLCPARERFGMAPTRWAPPPVTFSTAQRPESSRNSRRRIASSHGRSGSPSMVDAAPPHGDGRRLAAARSSSLTTTAPPLPGIVR